MLCRMKKCIICCKLEIYAESKKLRQFLLIFWFVLYIHVSFPICEVLEKINVKMLMGVFLFDF